MAFATAWEEEARLEASVKLNTKALTVMQLLYEKVNEQGLNHLCALITQGLQQIFPHRNYEVLVDVGVERGVNTLSFYLKEVKPSGLVVTSNIRNSTGGSIRAMVGLICTIFYILKMNGKRFLIMDEALSQLEDNALDGMFTLLKSFGTEAGFKYLLVTHDARFLPYGDKIYRMQSGKASLQGKADVDH